MADVTELLEEYEIPRDDMYEYTQSFTVEEVEAGGEALEFLDRYGVLVVRDVLTSDDCEQSMRELFGIIEAENSGFERGDINTWENWNARSYGMPRDSVIFTPQFLRNRMNPLVYRTYRAVTGCDKLYANHDRFVLYRPTVDGRTHWKTKCNLHLDCNPWRVKADDQSMWKKVDALRYSDTEEFIVENNHVVPSRGPFFQGILNLLDNHEEDGGFWMIPSFHRVFDEWVNRLGEMSDSSCRYVLPSTHAMMKRGRRVMAKAGSLILWDQRCLHGSCPNNSSSCRAMMCLRLFPSAHVVGQRKKARRKCLEREIKKLGMQEEVATSEFGRTVFGLE